MWTAPDGIDCARMRSAEISNEGAVREPDYPHWGGHVQECFELHGVDAVERPVLRKRLRRQQVLSFFAKLPSTRMGLEACGGSHYWAREIAALGHEAVLLPAQYVRRYVKRNKNDSIDADAVCEATSRPSIRFVPVKSAEQQAGRAELGFVSNGLPGASS